MMPKKSTPLSSSLRTRSVELVVDQCVLDAVAFPFGDIVGQHDLVIAALLVAVLVGLLRAVAGKVEDHEVAGLAGLGEPVELAEDGGLGAVARRRYAVSQPLDAVGQHRHVDRRDADAHQRVGDLARVVLRPFEMELFRQRRIARSADDQRARARLGQPAGRRQRTGNHNDR